MKIKCPVCRRTTTWEENPWRPFCSERCRLTDLGRWASEEYRIPAWQKDEGQGGDAEEGNGPSEK